jgi:hypothetical protein
MSNRIYHKIFILLASAVICCSSDRALQLRDLMFGDFELPARQRNQVAATILHYEDIVLPNDTIIFDKNGLQIYRSGYKSSQVVEYDSNGLPEFRRAKEGARYLPTDTAYYDFSPDSLTLTQIWTDEEFMKKFSFNSNGEVQQIVTLKKNHPAERRHLSVFTWREGKVVEINNFRYVAGKSIGEGKVEVFYGRDDSIDSVVHSSAVQKTIRTIYRDGLPHLQYYDNRLSVSYTHKLRKD